LSVVRYVSEEAHDVPTVTKYSDDDVVFSLNWLSRRKRKHNRFVPVLNRTYMSPTPSSGPLYDVGHVCQPTWIGMTYAGWPMMSYQSRAEPESVVEM